MGGSASKSAESAVQIAKSGINYKLPLGPPNPANPVVFLDIALGRYGDATQLGRIVIELKNDVVPKTSDNFLQLCQKEPGQARSSAPLLPSHHSLGSVGLQAQHQPMNSPPDQYSAEWTLECRPYFATTLFRPMMCDGKRLCRVTREAPSTG